MFLLLLGCSFDYGLSGGRGNPDCRFLAREGEDVTHVSVTPVLEVIDAEGYDDHVSVQFSLGARSQCGNYQLHDIGFSLALEGGVGPGWWSDFSEVPSVLQFEGELLSEPVLPEGGIDPDQPELSYTWYDEDLSVAAEEKLLFRFDWFGLGMLEGSATLDVAYARWTDEASGVTAWSHHVPGWNPIIILK